MYSQAYIKLGSIFSLKQQKITNEWKTYTERTYLYLKFYTKRVHILEAIFNSIDFPFSGRVTYIMSC